MLDDLNNPPYWMDKNIWPLAYHLNLLDGVETTVSCGGHEIREHIYQKPGGSWFVGFGCTNAESFKTIKDFCEEFGHELYPYPKNQNEYWEIAGVGEPPKSLDQ